MKNLISNSSLYIDYGQMLMMQGYFFSGKLQTQVVFDYFIKENPYGNGYVVFAGISDVVELIENIRFGNAELEYLQLLGFKQEFLQYLQKFRFNGTIFSMKEGEIAFPLEPIIRVEGNLLEVQMIETLLLNIINFQTLIATKASRIRYAAGNRKVFDFGLRRAQGFGSFHASKAAIIGGIDATSNTISAYDYSLDVYGMQSHAWIQSFGDELNAFRKYAEIYPNDCILLVDTYNPLRSGFQNAIKVAKEMEIKGQKLKAIRIDSGDLALLSKRARGLLDSSGLNYVQIYVSNQLDERLVSSLLQQGAPIDAFIVGTRLSTAHNYPALQGNYQISLIGDQPTLRFSDTYARTTLPHRKKVLRYLDANGFFDTDGIMLDSENEVDVFYHPIFTEQQRYVQESTARPLLQKIMEKGNLVAPMPSVKECAQYCSNRFSYLSPEYKRFENPQQYKIGISPSLMRLRSFLFEQMQKGSFMKK